MHSDWSRRLVIGSLVGVALATRPVAAHVDYVTEEGESGPGVVEFLSAVLSDPLNVAVLVAGGVGVTIATLGWLRYGDHIADVTVIRRTLRSYQPYLGWLLRLATGLPLMGAGFGGYFFSPAVGVEARLVQITIAFLLLFGLATRLAALAGLLTYLVGLATHFPTLLLSSEYLAGFLGILVVGPGQPSADLLLRRLIVTDGTIMSRFRDVTTVSDVLSGFGVEKSVAPLLIRLFLGFNFAYLGVTEKWLDPGRALQVVAKYDLTAVAPLSPEMWVFAAGLGELVVGLLILTGTFTRSAAGAGFVILTTTLFGLPDDPVLAHVTLFGLTSALLITGSGPLALDRTVIPTLRARIGTAPSHADDPATPAD
ncbi:DoxX family protein [Haloplanus aerogenes]|uniref:DoxX family protein n=1 Tax=Haloplanus aerogenes TaxID=660522 RepID=A0A3M0DRI5_9EURY|nr:DoxX family protein [Haloplanus aerogenes]AZH24235.1 DoxX family protein [Haloplanus aerogenes]RMB24137.1 putative membrane protein YphA (DoxX/SURF4 family) [Haloplanus aerogenes]